MPVAQVEKLKRREYLLPEEVENSMASRLPPWQISVQKPKARNM
jgi:hypothetical protein